MLLFVAAVVISLLFDVLLSGRLAAPSFPAPTHLSMRNVYEIFRSGIYIYPWKLFLPFLSIALAIRLKQWRWVPVFILSWISLAHFFIALSGNSTSFRISEWLMVLATGWFVASVDWEAVLASVSSAWRRARAVLLDAMV